MARALHQRGVLTKLRQSAGQDVDGGCGQLRARAPAGGERRIAIVPSGASDEGELLRAG
jgi:23S rRNA (adenine2503-C2)-methyltransferase